MRVSARLLLKVFFCSLLVAFSAAAQSRPKNAPKLAVSKFTANAARVAVTVAQRQRLTGAKVEIERRGLARALFIVQNPQHSFSIIDRALAPGVYRYRVRIKNRRGASPWSKLKRYRIEAPSEDSPQQPSLPGKPNLPAGMRECGDDAFYARSYARVATLRSAAGVPVLEWERQLYYSALAHSIAMAQRQYLSHDNFVDHVLLYQVPGTGFGQNVAGYHQDPVDAVNAWDGSPSHQTNMLNPRWIRSAIACVVDSHGYYWWTQHFAR